MQNSNENSSPANDPDDRDVQCSLGHECSRLDMGESLWSPPQFSLGSLMIAVSVLSVVCGMIKSLGLDWVPGLFGFATLGCLVWLMLGLYRIIRH